MTSKHFKIGKRRRLTLDELQAAHEAEGCLIELVAEGKCTADFEPGRGVVYRIAGADGSKDGNEAAVIEMISRKDVFMRGLT